MVLFGSWLCRNALAEAFVCRAPRPGTMSGGFSAVSGIFRLAAACVEQWLPRRGDCPPAQRLIRRTKPAGKLLDDNAYDSAPLRQWLKARGTQPVIPNKSDRKQAFRFDRKSYKQRHRIENGFCRLKDFDASPHAATGWHETSSPASASSQLSYGGFYVARPLKRKKLSASRR
jgi:putative transposase